MKASAGRRARSTATARAASRGRGRGPREPFFDLSSGIRGDEARRLLAPRSLESFIAEDWGKRPLYVRGTADKYAGLFSRDELMATLRSVRASASPVRDGALLEVRAFFDRLPDSPKVSIGGDQIETMFRAGATICVNAISAVNPKLAALAAAVKSQMSYPGLVRFNCYYSPDGCGFRRHFDARVATTLQIEGAKRWRYSRRPVVAWPRGNASVSRAGAPTYVADPGAAEDWEPIPAIDEDEFDEVTLRPGDLLVLPAGTWHECNADGESLALNLAFEPHSFTELLSLTLEEGLLHDPAFRSAPPLLSGPGAMPASISPWESYVRPGLERARAAIDALLADDQSMRRTWRRLVAGHYRGDRSVPVIMPAAPVTPSDVLELNRLVPCSTELGRDTDGTPLLTVWIGETELEVTGEPEIALVSRMLREGSFAARKCLAWKGVRGAMQWAAVAEMLQMLTSAGLLVRRSEPA